LPAYSEVLRFVNPKSHLIGSRYRLGGPFAAVLG
jgi:hypothetical protein